MAMHIKREITTVRVGDLVSAEFQRPIVASQVKQIVDNFDIHQFDYPAVGKEGDKYVVWDGQHRVTAIKALYGDDALVDVFIDDVGYQEMARKFAKQDEGRRNVSTVDKFHARIEAEDDIAVKIQAILDNYGLHIGTGNPANHIAAAKDIEKSYNRLGPITFETMIRVMQNGFDGSKDIWKSTTIKGMTEFFAEYADYNISEDILTNQIRTLDLEKTLEHAKMYNSRNSISGFVWHIATVYNKKRGGKNRLDTDRLLKKASK